MKIDDSPWSDRPMEMDVDLLLNLIEEHSRLTLRCLAKKLRCANTAVKKHLNESGKT